jgi:hypothetical protein
MRTVQERLEMLRLGKAKGAMDSPLEYRMVIAARCWQQRSGGSDGCLE